MARTHQLPTVLLLSSSPAGACPPAGQTPPDDAHAPRVLIELRAGLMNAGRDKSQADVARFRPLCDLRRRRARRRSRCDRALARRAGRPLDVHRVLRHVEALISGWLSSAGPRTR